MFAAVDVADCKPSPAPNAPAVPSVPFKGPAILEPANILGSDSPIVFTKALGFAPKPYAV